MECTRVVMTTDWMRRRGVFVPFIWYCCVVYPNIYPSSFSLSLFWHNCET